MHSPRGSSGEIWIPWNNIRYASTSTFTSRRTIESIRRTTPESGIQVMRGKRQSTCRAHDHEANMELIHRAIGAARIAECEVRSRSFIVLTFSSSSYSRNVIGEKVEKAESVGRQLLMNAKDEGPSFIILKFDSMPEFEVSRHGLLLVHGAFFGIDSPIR